MSHLYRCHQCFGVVRFEDLAHVDLYADLCWQQCDTCAAAFGDACGTDRRVNPNPHGYFACPYRLPRSPGPPPRLTVVELGGGRELLGDESS